ncbi:MAG: hypothetical protein ACYCWE_20325 [Eubacteriales bacterium]
MATLLMHLYVGKYFKDKYKKITDLPQYYLGCLYPDSVNAFGHASWEIRCPAHLRSKDIDEWYENNNIFYRQNTGKINEDFLLGYIIHNITDAAYDRHFYYINRDDWKRFNQEQCKEEWWISEVLPALKIAIPVSVNDISETNVKEWLRKLTDSNYWFNFPEDKPKEITINMMNELSDIVYKIVYGYINA